MTILAERTIYTKCYDHFDDLGDAIDLKGQFLIASQSAASGLWQVYTADITMAQDKPQSYQFTQSGNTEYEMFDAFKVLAQFELAKTREATTEIPDFTYPNATYFRALATQNSVIFDIDTGTPTFLENGTIPAAAGDYDHDEIVNASNAFAEALAKEEARRQSNTPKSSVLDQMFDPYRPAPVDYNALFASINAATKYKELSEALSACLAYMQKIDSTGSTEGFKRYLGRNDIHVNPAYDHIREVHIHEANDYDKSFKKAMSAAQTAAKSIKGCIDKNAYLALQQNVDIFDLCYGIMMIKMDLKKNLRQNESIDADAFGKAVKKLQSSYRLSDDIKLRIERACLDITGSSIPKILHEVVRETAQTNHAIQTHVKQNLNDVARKGTDSVGLSHHLAPEDQPSASTTQHFFQRIRKTIS